MIWNIFKKDFTLLWPYAVMLAALQIINSAFLIVRSQIDSSPDQWQWILIVSMVLCGAFLIVTLVHQDAITTVRQDWLVRPISRRDLLLSKILSVVLLIHLPMLAADMLYALVVGFPVGTALLHSVSRNILLLMMASFPILAFASLTKSLTEAVAGAFVLVLIALLFAFGNLELFWYLWRHHLPTEGTGLVWVPEHAGYLFAFISALVILYLQYFRRMTFTARLATVVAYLLVLIMAFFFPWNTAYAIAQYFRSEPGAGKVISFSFNPSAGRLHRVPTRPSDVAQDLYLPMRINGLTDDTVVRVDRSSTRGTFATGNLSLLSTDINTDFMNNGDRWLHVGFNNSGYPPWDLLSKEYTQGSIPIEIEMSATLLRRTGTAEATVLDGPGTIDGTRCLHWEKMIIPDWEDDESQVNVTLTCSPVLKPACYALMLAVTNFPLSYEVTPVLKCPADYNPLLGRLLPGGRSITAEAYLRDPAGNAGYSYLKEYAFQSKVSISSISFYKPVDHFTRTVVIPNFRFKDWTADTTRPSPAAMQAPQH